MTSRPLVAGGIDAGELRRPVERQMELGGIALHADVFHLAHEAGVDLARPDKVEEGGCRIDGRDDRPGAHLLAAVEHDADGAALLDEDLCHRRAECGW